MYSIAKGEHNNIVKVTTGGARIISLQLLSVIYRLPPLSPASRGSRARTADNRRRGYRPPPPRRDSPAEDPVARPPPPSRDSPPNARGSRARRARPPAASHGRPP
jgi:hypothetical protein